MPQCLQTFKDDFSSVNIKLNIICIYDEDGLKRAEAALGETLKGNKHYNLLDLTLLYDGKDFSNGYDGFVKVIIPLPKGHRDKTFSCYRLTEKDGKMIKELIPGQQTEDSYIIYLEHFSECALVATGPEEPHTHVYSTDWKSDATNVCIFYNIQIFFYRCVDYTVYLLSCHINTF